MAALGCAPIPPREDIAAFPTSTRYNPLLKTMNPNRSVKEMIALLQKEGHYVEFVNPRNGGLRITRIDDRRFSHDSSAGNALARDLTGSTLPRGYREYVKKRVARRARARRKLQPAKLSEFETKQLRKANRSAKKLGIKPLSTKQAGWLKKRRQGKGGFRSVIRDYKRKIYVLNHFDPSGAQELADRLRRYSELGEIADMIDKNKFKISSDTVRYIWESVYEKFRDVRINAPQAVQMAKNRIEKDAERADKWLDKNGLTIGEVKKVFS